MTIFFMALATIVILRLRSSRLEGRNNGPPAMDAAVLNAYN
jgi:hypothetical protein